MMIIIYDKTCDETEKDEIIILLYHEFDIRDQVILKVTIELIKLTFLSKTYIGKWNAI